MQHNTLLHFRVFSMLALAIALLRATPAASFYTNTPPQPLTLANAQNQVGIFVVFQPLVLSSPPTPTCASDHRDLELQVLELLNAERQKNGLPALAEHPALTLAACQHSHDMAANHFLSHTGSDGSQASERLIMAGYPGGYAGEIAGADGGGSAENRVASWMSSPKHRDAILSSVATEFGVGYATTTPTSLAPWSAYWTVDFGSR